MSFKISVVFLFISFIQISAKNKTENVGNPEIESIISPETIKEQQVKFMNATLDIELTNFRNARIFNANGNIFLLNGIDLYRLNVGSTSKDKNNLKKIGTLGEIGNQTISDIKASPWRDYTIFVADLDDYSNVYAVKNNDPTIDVLYPIEKLTKEGTFCKVKLFYFNRELYCVIVDVLNDQESSTMYFYKWRKSHFTRLEKVSTQQVNDFFAYTTDTFAIVVTIAYFKIRETHQTELNVYTLTDEDELKHKQLIYLDAANIFPITLNYGFYFYSVSQSGLLTSYQWKNEKFVKLLDYQDSKDVITFAAGENVIIGQMNDQLFAYTNVTSPPETQYRISQNFVKNFTKIIVTKSNQQVYVTFFYKSSDDLHMTTMKAEFEDVYNEQLLGESRDATGDCVADIRDIQRNRVPVIDIIRNMLPLIYYKDRNENIESKLHTRSLSIAKNAKIRRVNVDAIVKGNIKQIMNGIDGIAARLNRLRNNTVRHKRETEESIDTVNVKRLNIPKELFEKILVKTNGSATYKGKLTTRKLIAKSIKFGGSKDPNVGIVSPLTHKTYDNISRILNLEVKTINGINWNEFHSSVYLTDSAQPIEGDLIVTKSSRINHLDVTTVNEYPVSTLFTLNTKQEVSCNLILPTFHCPRIEANTINGIDFGNDVATLNQNNIIETPVKILQAQIGDLTLASSEDDEFITKHIIGTRVEDLSQVYNGKVTIKGSLKLSNVILDNDKASMFINEEIFGLNVAEHFWMKSVDQTIGNVTWTSIISTPQIFTTFLNSVPTEHFIIVNKPPKEIVNLVFQRVSVRGNVYTDTDFETSVSRINKESVRRDSSTVVSGTKTFAGRLFVSDFTGEFMDYPTTEDFVLNNHAENKFYLDCTKQFESLTVLGNVEIGGDNLILTHLNGFNLLNFFENAVKIDQPTRLGSVAFTSIKATNMTLNLINNHSFIDIVANLEESVGREGNLGSVHINGNVNIESLLVDTINDINFDYYLGLVVTSTSGGQIGGVKRFLAGLSVVNLFVGRINSIDVGYWLENALHKHKEQFIDEKWTLTTASINEMNANMINGLKVKEIVDLSVDVVEIRSDIKIISLDVSRNLNGEMACDVKNLGLILDNGLTKTNWNFVIVNGYVIWPENEVSIINEIVQFAVTGTDKIITGDVIFTNTTFVDNIQSTGIINKIDMKKIFVDSLVKTSKLQIIKESKMFKQPVSIANLVSEKDLRTPFINGVNVVQLNNSIFRVGDENIVSGIKTFEKPLKIERLVFDGLVNQVPVNDIVFVNSSVVLPPTFFQKPISIHKDLIIANALNGIVFDYLINNIIRKAGPPQEITGMITFQNLVVRGDTTISYINNVDINDIVLKTSDSIQEIIGLKTITGDLFIDGPIIITTINGLEVVDAYSSSIFLDENMIIRRLDVINEVILHKGLTVNSQINGIAIAPLIGWKPPTQTDLIPLWSNFGNIINEVDRLIHQNYGRSFHILYLDYASDIKVKFEAINNHPISFIIDTVHSGELCGLDHKCNCPAQYDVSIGPYQVFVNRRPYGERLIKMIGSTCNVTVRTSFINPCTAQKPIQTIIEWTTFTGAGSLTINDAVFGVKLYEIGNDIFLLVNHVNGSIFAMKFDQQANNWFTSDVISGNNIHMDVLEWKSFKVLIVLSQPSQKKNHDVARLWFYNTNVGRQGFEMYHEIAGEYNLCSKLYMRQEDKFVLFLSKAESQFVSIFIVHWGAQFQLFQTLTLNSPIKTFSSFTVDDSHCLAVVTTNGYLYLYKYNNVEGWMQIVYGFFKDIEAAMPFKHTNNVYLFISMKNSASVIRVYSQGLH